MKNQIVRANLRLVVSIAKRHVGPTDNFFELVSDGNMSLIRAVEKFDYRPRQQVQHVRQLGDHEELRPHDSRRTSRRDRFRTSQSEMFSARRRTSGAISTSRKRPNRSASAQIGKILERLDEREQKIIISRFGLDHGQEPLTLEGSWAGDGRDQGTRAADRSAGLGQAASGRPGRKDRGSRAE